MRLAYMGYTGIRIAGFYPYPIDMAEANKRSGASCFIPPPNGVCGRVLDPCSGEGEIASALGMLLNCETWGCELFPYRAEKAAARMDKCHSAAWESCSLTGESVTILGCNLPYDDDRHGDDAAFNSGTLVSNHQLHQRFIGCLNGYHHPILPGKGYRTGCKAGLGGRLLCQPSNTADSPRIEWRKIQGSAPVAASPGKQWQRSPHSGFRATVG